MAWILTERWETEFVSLVFQPVYNLVTSGKDGDKRLLPLMVLSGAVGWMQENPLDMLLILERMGLVVIGLYGFSGFFSSCLLRAIM